MEGGSAHIRNSPLLLKSTNEEREIKQSPEAARRHRLELVAGKAENIPGNLKTRKVVFLRLYIPEI